MTKDEKIHVSLYGLNCFFTNITKLYQSTKRDKKKLIQWVGGENTNSSACTDT